MKQLKVHKQAYLDSGVPVAICGVRGNIANHSDIKKVTCKKCIKLIK
jgi:hypothetical protein